MRPAGFSMPNGVALFSQPLPAQRCAKHVIRSLEADLARRCERAASLPRPRRWPRPEPGWACTGRRARFVVRRTLPLRNLAEHPNFCANSSGMGRIHDRMTVATAFMLHRMRRAPRSAVSDDIDRLVKSAQTGDARAFDQLYRHFYPLVHAIALAQVPYAEVEDVVQEVFTIVWRSLAALSDPGAFKAWLRTITRRHCIRHRSRCKPSSQLPENLGMPTPQLADALGLIAAMQGLPEDYQEILILRFCEGLSGPQIADLLGMTHGSVRVKIHRGLGLLRVKCGRKDGE